MHSQQQPLRARVPLQSEIHQPQTAPPTRSSHPHESGGMKLPLKSFQEQTKHGSGLRSHGSQPSTPQFSPTRGGIKPPATVQGSSATAPSGIISPMNNSGRLPNVPVAALKISNQDIIHTQAGPKSAPPTGCHGIQVHDDGRFYSGGIPYAGNTPTYPEQASAASQKSDRDELVGGSGPQSHPPNKQLPEIVKPPQPESVNQKQSYVHHSSDVTIQLASPGVAGPNKLGQSQSQPSSLVLDHYKSEEQGTPSPSQGQKAISPAQPNIKSSPVVLTPDPHSKQSQQIPHEEIKTVAKGDNFESQFENPLQRELDDEIHVSAAEVIQEVSGNKHEDPEDTNRPYDPNLICPMCMKKFRIGEIQYFKRHVNTCDGTDDDHGDWV